MTAPQLPVIAVQGDNEDCFVYVIGPDFNVVRPITPRIVLSAGAFLDPRRPVRPERAAPVR